MVYGTCDDPKDVAASMKVAINFLWSWYYLGENSKTKHKFFIDSSV